MSGRNKKKSALFFLIIINVYTVASFPLRPQHVNNYLKSWITCSYQINRQLLNQETLKITSAFLPFYLTGRHVDKKIHSFFYDAQTHTNKHMPAELINKSIDYQITEIPAWICRIMSIMHPDPEVKSAMQFFTVGLSWALVNKRLIKELISPLKAEICVRPAHGAFNKKWKNFCGFPSGHALLIAYTASYLGLYKGPLFAVPLSLYSGYVCAVRVANNSHFLSQVIAGAGLGTIFGFASYAAFKKRYLPENISVGLTCSNSKKLSAYLRYDF